MVKRARPEDAESCADSAAAAALSPTRDGSLHRRARLASTFNVKHEFAVDAKYNAAKDSKSGIHMKPNDEVQHDLKANMIAKIESKLAIIQSNRSSAARQSVADDDELANCHPMSTRCWPADISAALQQSQIGERIDPLWRTQVKAGVIDLLRGDSSVDKRFCPSMPRFNRMSGIGEWHNAVTLFVNVPHQSEPASDSAQSSAKTLSTRKYSNIFFHPNCDTNQLAMTWFAQSTQHKDTRIIQRILNAHKQSVDAVDSLRPDSKSHASVSQSKSQSRNLNSAIAKADADAAAQASIPNDSKAKHEPNRRAMINAAATPKSHSQPASQVDGKAELKQTSTESAVKAEISSHAFKNVRSDQTTTLLLFCRSTEAGSVYISCGRLQLMEFDADRRPMQAAFRLMDFESLVDSTHFKPLYQ